jgi:hypothetical protein
LNGFLELPEDWASKQLQYEKLATSLQQEFGIQLPQYGSVATWTATENANEVPTIGSLLATNLSNTPIDFQTLVSASKEFDGNSVYRIQEGVSSQLLESEDGDLFVFRITDSDPTRKPTGLDEVRDSVAYDLGRISSWKVLQQELDAIEQYARENGLLASSLKYDATVSRPQEVTMVDTGVPSILDPVTVRTLMSQSIVQLLANGQGIDEMASTIPSLDKNDAEVISTIIERAADLPIDVPVAALPTDQRIFVVPSIENMALVLVRVTGTSPASSELAIEFSSGTTNILPTMISVSELGGVASIAEVFSFENLASRHHFERGRRLDLEESESTAN